MAVTEAYGFQKSHQVEQPHPSDAVPCKDVGLFGVSVAVPANLPCGPPCTDSAASWRRQRSASIWASLRHVDLFLLYVHLPHLQPSRH